MAEFAVTLDDKYTLDEGRVFITGVQALARLPMIQRQRDVISGLNKQDLSQDIEDHQLVGMTSSFGMPGSFWKIII